MVDIKSINFEITGATMISCTDKWKTYSVQATAANPVSWDGEWKYYDTG